MQSINENSFYALNSTLNVGNEFNIKRKKKYIIICRKFSIQSVIMLRLKLILDCLNTKMTHKASQIQMYQKSGEKIQIISS